MENKQLEKLFRDKLSGMVIEPSDTARDKFEGKIQGRRRRLLARKIGIAASFLLVMLIGIYVFFPDTPEQGDLAQHKTHRLDKVKGDKPATYAPGGMEQEEETNESPGKMSGKMEATGPEETIKDATASDGTITEKNTAEDMTSIGKTTERTIPDKDDIEGNTPVSNMPKGAVTDRNKIEKTIPDGNSIEETMTVGPSAGESLARASQDHENNLPASGEENSIPDNEQLDALTGDMDNAVSVADKTDEKSYMEYNIGEPGAALEDEDSAREPVRITIEYISSGSNKRKQQEKIKDFYARMDDIKGIDEVYGDLREFKDRLFALDFMNNKKVKNEDK